MIQHPDGRPTKTAELHLSDFAAAGAAMNFVKVDGFAILALASYPLIPQNVPEHC